MGLKGRSRVPYGDMNRHLVLSLRFCISRGHGNHGRENVVVSHYKGNWETINLIRLYYFLTKNPVRKSRDVSPTRERLFPRYTKKSLEGVWTQT